MSDDEHILKLHDRATRGEALSPDEQVLLDQWYAAQDRAPSELPGLDAVDEALADVQAEIAALLENCASLTQRIRELSQSNDIQRQTALLTKQVTQHLN